MFVMKICNYKNASKLLSVSLPYLVLRNIYVMMYSYYINALMISL